MRKTMIFRSDRLLAAIGVASLVTVGSVRAQDTTQTRQTVHVVMDGETLWSIADLYFGDPFLWPEIYRLNTMVVEDPHWIFPGEELHLAPMPEAPPDPDPDPTQPQVDPVAQDPQAVEQDTTPTTVTPPPVAPPPPPSQMSPTVFRPTTQVMVGTISIDARSSRSVRRGEFYAAGFLSEGELLPWGKVKRSVGQVTITNLPQATSTLLHGQIEIEPPPGGTYHVGDSLLIASASRKVKQWGEVILPAGIAVVTASSSSGVFAEVVRMFQQVSGGLGLLPLEPFVDPGEVLPVPTQSGLEGTVIDTRDQTALPGQQDIVFVDLGRADGVALGDVFVMLRRPAAEAVATDTVAMMQIVHRREHSASGLIGFIRSMGVESGAVVKLIRKMP